MKTDIKVGFIVTAHWSDMYRPDGGEYIQRFCKTLNQYCKYNFNLYVVDNASQYKLPITDNAIYLFIEDQTKKGITGAWNLGINKAYEDGCDIIVNCNDDIWFNDSINLFIDQINLINNENSIYAPLSDGIISGPQKSNHTKTGTVHCQCTNAYTVINGFCFAMTRAHYEKFRYQKNEYFNKDNKHNGNDGKWGGQEGQFIENSEKGLFGTIINECWLPHTKVRGWTKLRGK